MQLIRLLLITFTAFWFIVAPATLALADDPAPAKKAQTVQAQDQSADKEKTAEEENQPVVTQDNPNNTLEYERIFKTLPKSQFDKYFPLDLVHEVLRILSIIIAALALIGLIYSGIMFITAGGDDDKAKKAKQNIIWIITGIVIYILGYLVLYEFLDWVING